MRDSKILGELSPYDPNYMPAETLLSANENPFDVPGEVKLAVRDRLAGLPFNRYPQPTADILRGMLAERIYDMVLPTLDDTARAGTDLPGVSADQIVVGNGGDELLFDLMLAFGGEGNALLVTPPSFSVYEIDAQMTGTEVVEVPMGEGFSIDGDAVIERASRDDVNMVILTSPNNPTASLVDLGFLERLLESTDAIVMMDEAYGEFAERTSIPLVAKYPNLCVLRTFSKAYSLAGIRLGYMVASPEVVGKMLMVRQPYSVDAVSQAIGEEVVRRCELYGPVVRAAISRREELLEKLRCINGLEVFPSRANFILVRLAGADRVWDAMVREDGVLVRNLGGQEYLEGCLRITVGSEEDNQRMLDSLAGNIAKGLQA